MKNPFQGLVMRALKTANVATSNMSAPENLLGIEPEKIIRMQGGSGPFSPRTQALREFYSQYGARPKVDPSNRATNYAIGGGLLGGGAGAGLGAALAKKNPLLGAGIGALSGGGLGVLAGHPLGRATAERDNSLIEEASVRGSLTRSLYRSLMGKMDERAEALKREEALQRAHAQVARQRRRQERMNQNFH